jgi:hypothetical protein
MAENGMAENGAGENNEVGACRRKGRIWVTCLIAENEAVVRKFLVTLLVLELRNVVDCQWEIHLFKMSRITLMLINSVSFINYIINFTSFSL